MSTTTEKPSPAKNQGDAESGYKRDQGRMARMIAFWTLAILLFYGSVSLHTELSGRWPEDLAQPFGGGLRIPLLGLDVTPALLIAAVVCAGGLFVLYTWQQRPKVADLLIETEAEMRKVTWPTLGEAVNSSVVVFFCVLFLMAFLAGSDWALGRWAGYLFWGQ